MSYALRSVGLTFADGHVLHEHAHPWGQLIFASAGTMRVKGGLAEFYPGIEASYLQGLLKVRAGRGQSLDGVGTVDVCVLRKVDRWDVDVEDIANALPTLELAQGVADGSVTRVLLSKPVAKGDDLERVTARPLMLRRMQSPEQGARTSLYCATSAEVVP